MNKFALQILSFILGLASSSVTVMAEDWPWFLGPRHTGVSGEVHLTLDWTDRTPPVIWKEAIGAGYSAPSVLGDRVVIHHREENREIVSCRHVETGKEIWANIRLQKKLPEA